MEERITENPLYRVGTVTPGELERFLPLVESYQRMNSVSGIRRGRNRGFFGRLLDPSQHGMMLGAQCSDQPIAFACLQWELDSTRARDLVRLTDLFVAEDWRRDGVGSSLLTTASELARARGAPALVCRIGPENLAARGLLAAVGAESEAAVGYELRL